MLCTNLETMFTVALLIAINALSFYPLYSFRLGGVLRNCFHQVQIGNDRIILDSSLFAKKDKKASTYKTAPPTKSEKQGR